MTETAQTLPLPLVPDAVAARLDADSDRAPDAGAPGWLADLRRAGLSVYRTRGLPTVRVEAFKYTGLAGLQKVPYALDDGTAPPALASLSDALALDDAVTDRVILVNGRPVDLPTVLPAGVRVAGLAHLLATEPGTVEPHLGRIADLAEAPMGSLNTALMADGLVVLVDPGVVVDRPLHVVHIATAPDGARHVHPRHLMVLGEGAAITVVESRVSAADAADTLTNAVTEVQVGEGARLRHLRLVNPGPQAVDLDLTEATLADAAALESFTLTLGGRLVRNEGRVRLCGAGATARLHGAYATGAGQHADTTLLVDHAVADTTSDQLFKGVVDAGGRGVFQGKVIVRRNAQRSDGAQLHKALLLSRDAEVDTKPELEIYADDVKCSHGATAGDLDPDQLFYLMARGIPEADARALLVEAFLDDVVDSVPDGPVRTAFRGAVRAWQSRRAAATWEE